MMIEWQEGINTKENLTHKLYDMATVSVMWSPSYEILMIWYKELMFSQLPIENKCKTLRILLPLNVKKNVFLSVLFHLFLFSVVLWVGGRDSWMIIWLGKIQSQMIFTWKDIMRFSQRPKNIAYIREIIEIRKFFFSWSFVYVRQWLLDMYFICCCSFLSFSFSWILRKFARKTHLHRSNRILWILCSCFIF